MPTLVTLVNTNQVKPAIAPIAFDYLSTALQRAGYEVDLLDLCFEENFEQKIVSYCNRRQPDHWGVTLRNTDDVYFSSSYSFLDQIRKIAQIVRRESSVPITLGGVGFSVMPQKLLEHLEADFGIVCEGEFAFPELIGRLSRQEDISDIPGLLYRSARGIEYNPMGSGKYGALADVGAHQRTTVDNRLYFAKGGQIGIETKRGCNRRCIYCVEPLTKGQQVRLRNPVHIVDEMKSLLEQGINVFHINDSEFNLSISHPISFCEEILRRGLEREVKWYAYGMPAPFPDKLASAMSEAGCVGMNFGVDSASEKMLKILRRTFTPNDIRNAVVSAKRYKLEHIVELLFGAPGETRETVRETIEFIKDANPDRVSVTVGLRIFPGTELENMVRAEYKKNKRPFFPSLAVVCHR